MTTLAHIAGVPVEELAATLLPAAAVWIAALRHLFSRAWAGSDGSDAMTESATSDRPVPQAGDRATWPDRRRAS